MPRLFLVESHDSTPEAKPPSHHAVAEAVVAAAATVKPAALSSFLTPAQKHGIFLPTPQRIDLKAALDNSTPPSVTMAVSKQVTAGAQSPQLQVDAPSSKVLLCAQATEGEDRQCDVEKKKDPKSITPLTRVETPPLTHRSAGNPYPSKPQKLLISLSASRTKEVSPKPQEEDGLADGASSTQTPMPKAAAGDSRKQSAPKKGRPSVSPKQRSPKSLLAEGERIVARFRGNKAWYPGRISGVDHATARYDIAYDDGDQERGVRRKFIRRWKPPSQSFDSPGSRQASCGNFKVGDRVDARFQGGAAWYPGHVSKEVDTGLYTVAYDDGDVESNIAAALIRPRIDTPTTGEVQNAAPKKNTRLLLCVGDRVRARFRGRKRWYPGHISEVLSGSRYAIDYDDGDKETRVPARFVRRLDDSLDSKSGRAQPLLQQGRQRQQARPTPAKTKAASGDTTASVSAPPAPKRSRTQPNLFCAGDRVEARFKGGRTHYTGTVEKVLNNGTYNICYDDGDKEKGVEPSLMRKLAVFAKGDAVEARFKGGAAWYSGRVVKVLHKSKRYNITYDDGDTERRVPAEFVRALKVLPPGSMEFDKGDAVEARYAQGKLWYPGHVTAVLAMGAYNILYDDGYTELCVAPHDVRAQRKSGSTKQQAKRHVSESCLSTTAASTVTPSSSGDAVSTASVVAGQPPATTPSFEQGQRIEARFGGGGEWYPGVVVVVAANHTYDLRYDDGDIERGVPASLVRVARETDEEDSDATNSPPPSSKKKGKKRWKKGDVVEARYGGGGEWYPGRVTKVDTKGNCNIDYEDGDKERKVAPHLIRGRPQKDDDDKDNDDETDTAEGGSNTSDVADGMGAACKDSRKRTAVGTFKAKWSGGSTSKFRGVSWNRKDRRWVAKIRVNGVQLYLGNFKEEEAAAHRYDKEARLRHGAQAKLNFP